MAKAKIENGTVAWFARYNLGGIFYDKPVRVTYKEGVSGTGGYWFNASSKFDLYEELPLGVTQKDRVVTFISKDKREVELFIGGMVSVVAVARNSLFA